MSIQAGKVAAVSGTVQAINPQTGEIRILLLGDEVFADEVIQTSLDGQATIDLNNGEVLTLGRDTDMVLDEDVLGSSIAPADVADAEALREAILAGNVDLENLEEPAAGDIAASSSANAGGENLVERLGSVGEVTSGFDTTGISTSTADRTFVEGVAVNEPPVAADDIAALNEDASQVIDVLANDTDLDGDTLTVVAVTQPENGSVVINPDGTVTYTPFQDYNGSDSFTYTIEDGNGGTDTALVSVTVNPQNDPPVAVDDVASLDEDSSKVIDVLSNDTDLDGDTLSVQSVTQPENGSVVINPDGTVTYTPIANYNGTDSFTYVVEDGNGGTDTALVTLTINPQNDEPVAVADIATLDEDSSQVIDVLANDTDLDGDTLSVQSVTQPENGVVVINPDGTVTYTPIADYNGHDSFSYTMVDGNGGTDTTTVSVTVAPIVDIADDSVEVAEDTTTIINVLDNDTFEGTPVITSTTDPTHGSITINQNGTITYDPDPNYNGSDSFTYTVTSGGVTETATVNIDVTPVNDPPTIESEIEDQVLPEDFVSYQIDLNAAFADIETSDSNLSYSVVGNSNIGVSIVNGIATISQAVADWNGSETLTFTATDEGGLSVSQDVNFTVSPVVDIVGDSVDVVEDTPTIINMLNNDSFENVAAEVTSTTDATHGTVVLNPNGTVTYTPDADYYGSDSFTYTVTSGGVTETATVNIDVTPVNDPPTIESEIADQVLPEDFVSYQIDLNTAFADIETSDSNLTYSVSGNSNIGVSIINGIATISQAVADWNGSEVLTFTATDEGGLSVSQDVNFTVTPVVDIVGDSVEVDEDTPIIINVLNNDSFENVAAEVTSTTDATHGTVVLNPNGTVTYTPDADYYGSDSFTYTVTSGGVTETATVNINVTPVNDIPDVENVTLHTDNLIDDWIVAAMPVTLSEEGPNTLSWDLTNVPDLYSGGELVSVYVIDGMVVGEIGSGEDITRVFELSVDLNEGTEDAPQFVFKQFQDLIAGETIENIDFGNVSAGNTSVGGSYGFALLDLDGNLVATAEATGIGSKNTVNTNNSTMGVGNTFIDSGETLTIDFSQDSGTFTEGTGSNEITYDFVASGVQGMLVTLSAFDTDETATYSIYGKDADGNDVQLEGLTIDGSDSGAVTFEILSSDIPDAVYIDKVVFGSSEGSYQLDFDAITTVSVDEDVSMPIGYTVEDVDGDYDSGIFTVNLYGGEDGTSFAYVGDDNSHDVFDMGEPGSTATIENYDIANDTLEVSDVIEDTAEQVAANTLSEYLEFTAVDSDNDGQVDDTQILIDSNGESDAGGTITTVYIQDETLDETDIDDMKIDYQQDS
ncbi:retention module-containing protein [Thiomicrorhabdus sp. ZW0627]|uniref:retention module-containing protein n=1 Tax=Thiomicrorhabdus sp. ZW0627 TaxID=3039774 RepID=UPI0024365994|nr:retention module-containing protein [Thiomicrorhabdus sp. ZW0627]MDG6774176.1 retention module-containing protein [Thiomicrorhabdus sp. ZW0627]